MRAARGQANEDVARNDARTVDGPRLFDDTDGKAREVVLAGDECFWMLSGFAADQCATGLFATRRNALDDGGRDIDVKTLANVIVEEEERLGALHQDVVDAHRHQIDADGVVLVHGKRELELGADAVGARDQHRLAVTLGKLDERTEAADPGQHLGPQCALRERLDRIDQTISCIDVDTGVAIREGSLIDGHGMIESSRRARYSERLFASRFYRK